MAYDDEIPPSKDAPATKEAFKKLDNIFKGIKDWEKNETEKNAKEMNELAKKLKEAREKALIDIGKKEREKIEKDGKDFSTDKFTSPMLELLEATVKVELIAAREAKSDRYKDPTKKEIDDQVNLRLGLAKEASEKNKTLLEREIKNQTQDSITQAKASAAEWLNRLEKEKKSKGLSEDDKAKIDERIKKEKISPEFFDDKIKKVEAIYQEMLDNRPSLKERDKPQKDSPNDKKTDKKTGASLPETKSSEQINQWVQAAETLKDGLLANPDLAALTNISPQAVVSLGSKEKNRTPGA